MVDRCDPSQRLKHNHVPDFALDLVLDCQAKFSAFTARTDAGTNLSPAEFSKLITAPMLESDAGVSGAALCAGQNNGGWYFEPRDMPERVVLCPVSCELFRRQVQFVLSQDGCDGPFDGGGPPNFGGSGFPGGGPGDGPVPPGEDAGHP